MSQMVDCRYLVAAERLWQILDNIDSLSDVIKPTTPKGYAAFYHGVMNRIGERFKVLTSDGYTLRLPEECALKIREETGHIAQQTLCGSEASAQICRCDQGESWREFNILSGYENFNYCPTCGKLLPC